MNLAVRTDATELLLAIAAARLALRLPEAGLAARCAALAPFGGATVAAIQPAQQGLMQALAGEDTAFARLARAARLSAFDLDLLGLAALPALDDHAGEAIEALMRGGRRLTVGATARLLLPPDQHGAALRHALERSPIWGSGALRLQDRAQPVAERRLDPTPTLLAALDDVLPSVTAEGWLVQRLPMPSGAPGSLAQIVAALRGWAERGSFLLLLESARSERAAEALAAAAGALGRPALLLHPPPGPPAHPPWAEAGALAAATGGLVALLAEGEALHGPTTLPLAPLAVIGAEAVGGRLVARRHLRIPPPLLAEQHARWTATRADLPAAEATALAAQNWMAQADIAAIAAAAERADPPALLAARMAVAPPRAARLAALRAPAVAWDRLVLEAPSLARLEDIVRRVRHRATVREAWKMDAGGSALVALLTGDPGTGKTLAAEAVALRLGLPLLVADLSRVVSKYIGETEKNLAELFAAAEGFAAVLFFDEADALFGKRTSVQDAHDRYANIEVNYLLQRLERFEGVAMLATNQAEGMDEAFLRRFDLTVPFRRPGPAQRLALWRAHLPAAQLAPGLDLAALAQAVDVTGGEIRNAALTAAYAAAEAGTRIDARLLRAALAQELAKAGRPVPHGLEEAAR
jgi:hypothetical protein